MKGLLVWLARVESVIASLAYVIVTALLLGEIVAREIFATSIEGSLKMAVFAAIIAGFVGMSLATSAAAHLRPRVADSWIPATFQPVVKRIADLVSAIIFALFGVVSAVYVHESFLNYERAAVLYWPLWPIQLVIPLAFFSSALKQFAFAVAPSLKPSDSAFDL